MKLLVIRKLSAVCLIVLTIVCIISTYVGTYVHIQQDEFIGKLMYIQIADTLYYYPITALIWVGFQFLYGLLILRNKLYTKFFIGLWIFNLIGIIWWWFMFTQGTMKGVEVAIWSNMIILSINAFFATLYFFNKKD